ncbi:phospholipase A [Rugamonas sp.]|uniref:phospholipase A n=1 Tax=Rugamonas sp. TaxID=1926287 RepID=UPI0025FA9B44|nr:phospholipase A [Rugamonas sp.]
MKNPLRTALLSALAFSPALSHATELEQSLERCAQLGDPSARLACFDGLAKAAPKGDEAIVNAKAAAPASTQPLAPAPAVAAAVAANTKPEAQLSPTVQLWELDPAAKRGVFNFKPFHSNYLLLANYSSATNDTPFDAFTPGGLKSKHVELTYQLSLKMKALEQIGNLPIDLWLGYTQQSFWQAYNRAASSPFRETNYQPEALLTTPLHLDVGGVQFRYFNLALEHQSNGQTSTLSRSWNRIYGEVGVEDGKLAVALRIWKRLDNARSDNDNIDITNYMGHGDVTATYRVDGNEFSLLARRNFAYRRGALQLGWAFPLVANLKGYVQAFSGYGESLIDYNYSQKSLGAGFLVAF